MAALARDGARNERIRRLASRFGRLHVYGLPRGLDSYIRSVFTYSDEAIETLKSAERMLDEIEAFGGFSGDCDDVSIWTATLGLALGRPVRFVAIRLEGNPEFEHVFTDIDFLVPPHLSETRRAWIRFDATVPYGTNHEYEEAMVEHV